MTDAWDGYPAAAGPDQLGAVESSRVQFFNGQRGYLRCRVTKQEWRTDYRMVPFVSREGAGVSTRASFVVRDGKPELESTGKPRR